MKSTERFSSFDAIGWFSRDIALFEKVGDALLGDDKTAAPSRLIVADDAWEQVARVHGEVFAEIRPATSIVEVAKLIDAKQEAFSLRFRADDRTLTADELTNETQTPVGPGTVADMLTLRVMDTWIREEASLWEHQQALQDIADKTEEPVYPGTRAAGTAGYDASVDYVAGLLDGLGAALPGRRLGNLHFVASLSEAALAQIGTIPFSTTNSFALAVIPLFILMGSFATVAAIITLFGNLTPTHAGVPFGGPWSAARLAATFSSRRSSSSMQTSRCTSARRRRAVSVYSRAGGSDASWALQEEIDRGDRIVVGGNDYREGDEEPLEILRIDPALESKQIGRVQAVRARRDSEAVESALARVRDDAAGGQNLMPSLLDAARVHATEGEIVEALQDVFGSYTETPVF